MNVRLYSDETIHVDLDCIAISLNEIAKKISFAKGKMPFSISGEYVSNPKTYKNISASVIKEIHKDQLALLFTEKPYDNNYFWDAPAGNLIIVSLFEWDILTTLPRSNGIVYFIIAIITRQLGIGISHKNKNIGCINDFWQDKTGIDVGMRSAYICESCKSKLPKGNDDIKEYLSNLHLVLNDLCASSRLSMDICQHWSKNAIHNKFDVFLCHNSLDKSGVRKFNESLKKKGIKTWFDEEQLPPGRVWQELLESQIESINSVAVFVGESGIGPWQDIEMRAFISEFVSRKCAVIPVIMDSCKEVPKLPLFLRQFMWVDFRKDEANNMHKLLWGITGVRPNKRQQANNR